MPGMPGMPPIAFMPFIMSMPSCMAFVCSAIRAWRSAGVWAAAILVRIACMVAMCCCMCCCICGIEAMPMGMPAGGATAVGGAVVAVAAGWCRL